jgi:DNA-binding response OmpR family regulator
MNKIKVLLAEDEASLGMIVKESLGSRDFIVFHGENGEIASEIYQKEKPDILVLDVMMPLKDGFTLAKEIRLENKKFLLSF